MRTHLLFLACMPALTGVGNAQEFIDYWEPAVPEPQSVEFVASGALDNAEMPKITALTPEEASKISARTYVADNQPENDAKFLYASTEKVGMVTFNLPAECAFYRVAFLTYEQEAEVENIYAYLTDEGYENRTTTYPASQSVITIEFTKPYRYQLAYVKLDAAGQPLNHPDTGQPYCSTARIYSNYQGDYEWRSLGTGTLIENISHHGVDKSTLEYNDNDKLVVEPFSYDVEVEVRADNPAIFRVKNPFGPNHPNYDNLTLYIDKTAYAAKNPELVKGDDYYMIFNATDPSRVEVEYSMSGFFVNMIFSGPHNLKGWDKWNNDMVDKYYGWEWGKYYDNKIVMPQNSMYIGHKSFDYAKSGPDISLRLPGYVSYSFDYDITSGGVIIKNIAPSIKSFRCALIRETEAIPNRFFSERLCEMAITREEGVLINDYSVKNGEDIIVNSKEFKDRTSGRYALVTIPQDAQDNYHRGRLTGSCKLWRRESTWNHLGTGIFGETVLTDCMSGAGNAPYRTEVEVYEYPDLAGYYILKNPYGNFPASDNENFYYDTTKDHYMYVDATNPERVTLNFENLGSTYSEKGQYIPTGMVFRDQSVSIFSKYNRDMYRMWSDRECCPEEYSQYVGKLNDGVITFPEDAFSVSLGDEFQGTGTMTIYLSKAAIESVTASDDDAPATYYNLQGMRVDNPRHGLYIRKQGSGAEVVHLD